MKTVHEKAIQVCGGSQHSHVLVESGKVFSMGSNFLGQLGLGDYEDRSVPCLIDPKSFNNEKIVQICSGYYHSVALSHKGNIYMWGQNSRDTLRCSKTNILSVPQKINPSYFMNERIKFINIESTRSFFAVTENNKVFSWGFNLWGELALGSNTDHLTPQLIDANTYNNEKVLKIRSNFYHTMLLTENGNIFSCGRNSCGQLGLIHSNDVKTFQHVESKYFNNEKVKDIDIYEIFSLVLTEYGNMYSWGPDYLTKVNLDYVAIHETPRLIDSSKFKGEKFSKICCGDSHCFAISNSGKVHSWGYNDNGELGLGHYNSSTIPEEINSEHFNGERVIYVKNNTNEHEDLEDYNHTFAITQTGKLFGWGRNNDGQLGLGHNTTRINTPQQCYSEVFGVVPNSKTYKNTSFEDVKIEFDEDCSGAYSDDYCKHKQSFNELYKEISHIEIDMDMIDYDSELEEECQHPKVKQMVQQVKDKQELFFTYCDVFKTVFPSMLSKDKAQIKKCDRMKQKFRRILK